MTAITIIIPTTCERTRWQQLERAIDSVVGQRDVAAQVIAVVNGSRYDADCLAALRHKDGVAVLYRSTGSAPLAQSAGRDAVHTPYFGFLDDDDEYLPGALATRLAPLLANPALDFVVTDGYRALDGHDTLAIGDTAAIRADPLAALCERNWMASCAGLFRSSSVTPDYFANPAAYMEWTYLAFRLSQRLTMAWLDTPTYRIHDTPLSLSKSDAYVLSELEILRRVLALPLPPHTQRAMRAKFGRACHDFSDQARSEYAHGAAWRYHLSSLVTPGGWRYLPYTFRLVENLWRRHKHST